MYINSLNGEYKFFIFPIKRINIHLKMQQIHYNILITVAKTCEKVLRCLILKVEQVFNNKSESSKIFIFK